MSKVVSNVSNNMKYDVNEVIVAINEFVLKLLIQNNVAVMDVNNVIQPITAETQNRILKMGFILVCFGSFKPAWRHIKNTMINDARDTIIFNISVGLYELTLIQIFICLAVAISSHLIVLKKGSKR